MLRQESKQVSFHADLYNKIPETHILKNIGKAIDFSFINSLLESSYCKNFGRPAKEPELMAKLLFLQHLYTLSDEKVIEEASLNLAFMFFLGLNPEDNLPDKSLLAKFRCHRLKDTTLDEIIVEIVKQCVEKGIIKGTGVSIDSTHIVANTVKKTPERLMKHLSRRIIKDCEIDLSASKKLFGEIPNYEIIEDHQEAKAVMKAYLEQVLQIAESLYKKSNKKNSKEIKKAKEILSDPDFMLQKGTRSLVDEDARVGRKSKTESFYGYKTEFAMTSDERIITSVRTNSGEYMDGTYAKEMIADTQAAGIKIEDFFGDKAYFRKPILDELASIHATAYIPVSQVVYRVDESQFKYNKDSDQWYCSEGNWTVSVKRYKSKTKNGFREGYNYSFDTKQCMECPNRANCIGKAKRKILRLGLNANEFYEISQWQKKDEFLENYKKRAVHESKNAELKRFHGMARARGYGLKSVAIQSKLAAIAVNIKRIAGIVSALYSFKNQLLNNLCFSV